MKEEDIVRLYQRGTSARLGPRRTDCVTPDEMVAVVERLGSEDDRLKTINHAMACADCADELELLRSMRIVKERARLPRFGYAVAASAVLVIGLGYYNLARSRAPAERGVLRDAASDVQLVAPIAPTVPQLDTLVWRAVDNATGYVVEVRRGDGTLVGRTATTDTSMASPRTPRVEPGAEVYWSVTARLADGTERRSEARRVRIIP